MGVPVRPDQKPNEQDELSQKQDEMSAVDPESNPRLSASSGESAGAIEDGAKAGAAAQEQRKAGCLVRLSTALNDTLSGTFYSVGRFVGTYPWLTILMSLALTGGLAVGLACCFTTESQPEKLFVPQGTRSLADREDLVANFGQSRFVSFAVTAKTDKEGELGNVLTKEALLAFYDFYEAVITVNTTYSIGDEEYVANLDDLCVAFDTPQGRRCAVNSVLFAFWYTREEIENEEDVLARLADRLEVEQLEQLVGGLEMKDGKPVSGKVLSLSMQLEKNLVDPNPADDVEEEVDVAATAWEKRVVDVANEVDPEEPEWAQTLSVYMQSEYSFSTEIGNSIVGDVGIVSASYFIIIGYVVFAMQQRCDRVFSSVGIALLSAATIGMGIASSFGLSQYLGIKYGNTHSILPFIVLGVGADGAFILVNAFRRTPLDKPLPERAGEALAHAGVSLSVSSLTNVAAFAIGSLTVIPDLSSFGKYAALALFFLWVYLCTFYMAVLVLDARRMEKRRLDFLCCAPSCRSEERNAAREPEVFRPGPLSRWMRRVYAPLILTNWFRAMVLVLTAGFVGFCGWQITNLRVEATGSNFLPDGSYLKTNFDLTAEYFGGQSTRVQVVVKDFDLANREELLGLGDKFRFENFETEAPFIDPTFTYWLTELCVDLKAAADAPVSPSWTDVTADDLEPVKVGDVTYHFPKTEERFFELLDQWLGDPEATINAAPGAFFASSFVFADDSRTSIVRAATLMEHIPIGDFDDDGIFKEDASKIVAAVDKMYEIADSFSFAVYPYAFTYTNDWASFKVIGDELVQNVGLALLCVFVVVTLLIGNPGCSLLVFLSCAITIVELLGVNAFLGLAIDTVVTVLVVLAVGLAVDYSAHLGYGFMLEEGTRAERIAAVLEDVGVPVLNGAISTFLAIMLQSMSKSYVFVVVFIEFSCAIAFGALNGIVLLPILLSLIGPAPYAKKPHASAPKAEP